MERRAVLQHNIANLGNCSQATSRINPGYGCNPPRKKTVYFVCHTDSNQILSTRALNKHPLKSVWWMHVECLYRHGHQVAFDLFSAYFAINSTDFVPEDQAFKLASLVCHWSCQWCGSNGQVTKKKQRPNSWKYLNIFKLYLYNYKSYSNSNIQLNIIV